MHKGVTSGTHLAFYSKIYKKKRESDFCWQKRIWGSHF